MNMRRGWVSLAIALAAGSWAKISMAETTPDVQLAAVEPLPRQPIVGVG